jgi:hypothetical protein
MSSSLPALCGGRRYALTSERRRPRSHSRRSRGAGQIHGHNQLITLADCGDRYSLDSSRYGQRREIALNHVVAAPCLRGDLVTFLHHRPMGRWVFNVFSRRDRRGCRGRRATVTRSPSPYVCNVDDQGRSDRSGGGTRRGMAARDSRWEAARIRVRPNSATNATACT